MPKTGITRPDRRYARDWDRRRHHGIGFGYIACPEWSRRLVERRPRFALPVAYDEDDILHAKCAGGALY